MTELVVEDLKTTLTQTVTLNQYRTYHIAGVKIKLMMFNEPAGTFTLSLKQGATTLASKDFTSADIKTDLSTSDAYAHLYKAIDFGNNIPLSPGSYDFVLSSSGYTYSDASFLGWVRSHENLFIQNTNEFTEIFENPMDVLIYENLREDLVK